MRFVLTCVLVFFFGCDSPFNSDPGSIDIIISSDVARFSSLDPVELTVTVTNNTEDKFTLYPSSTCVLTAELYVEDQNRYFGPDQRVFADYVEPIELQPGDSFQESWSWDGSYFNGEEIEYLEPGIHQVIGIGPSNLESNLLSLEFIVENF